MAVRTGEVDRGLVAGEGGGSSSIPFNRLSRRSVISSNRWISSFGCGLESPSSRTPGKTTAVPSG